MAHGVLVYGRSGQGKSRSIINLPAASTLIVNVEGKALPFKGASKIPSIVADTFETIFPVVQRAIAKGVKHIVIDDFQYLMVHEFMNARKIDFDGWDRMAKHAYQFLDLPRITKEKDVFFYILAHEEESTNSGLVGVRTLGKLLDNKVCIEGKFSIALRALNVPGKGYVFSTQTDGSDVTKSPEDMFDKYEPNDLLHISKKILEYYNEPVDKTEQPTEQPTEHVAPVQETQAETEKKRTRRTKAEMEAAKAEVKAEVNEIEEKQEDAELELPPAPVADVIEGDKISELASLFGSEDMFKAWLVERGTLKKDDVLRDMSEILIKRMYENKEAIAKLALAFKAK